METAKNNYEQAASNAHKLLKKIESGLAAKKVGNPDWADVGDMKYLASQLQEISDQLNHEGEYK